MGPTFGAQNYWGSNLTSPFLGRFIPTCPLRIQWSLQAWDDLFLPWSDPDGQVGAACCGCSGYKELQSQDVLCDDG